MKDDVLKDAKDITRNLISDYDQLAKMINEKAIS